MQKCCVCVAKPNVATIERVTSTTSVAKNSTKELRKTVEMDRCQSIAKFWKKRSTLLQPLEDFKRVSIVLLRMNKHKKDCPTFIQKNRRRWNTHKTLTLVSFDNSFNYLCIFVQSN